MMKSPSWARAPRKSVRLGLILVLLSSLFFGFIVAPIHVKRPALLSKPWSTDVSSFTPARMTISSAGEPWADAAPEHRSIHIIMPATQPDVNFCKTLLTMNILGYPNPHIVAWGDDDETGGLLGGGSHFAKITRTLDYMNAKIRRKRPGFDDELIMMIDSFDIWFQLPFETLISRYYDILKEENDRVAHRMGRAYSKENIFSDIVFGGGKRCAPNQIHTLACFPVPESPLPMDIHGGETDTILGRNLFSSFRTRYLNSGYMIGPIKKMRPLLEKAQEKMMECAGRTDAWFDDGSHGTDRCYGGSDQSVFVEMFGEQEFHREVMRRHHRDKWDDMLDKHTKNRPGSRPPPTQVWGVPVDDMLDPSISHQHNDPTYKEGKPFEYGMAIDYWSTLGHQTSNAEADHRYLRHNETVESQMGELRQSDCRGTAFMPDDLPTGVLEILKQEPNTWDTMPMYSEVCVGTMPVMIHHNSMDKSQRESQWERTWWHGRARQLLETQRKRRLAQMWKGVPTDKGDVLSWEELCPREFEPELFRDITTEQVEAEKAKQAEREKLKADRKAEQEADEKGGS